MRIRFIGCSTTEQPKVVLDVLSKTATRDWAWLRVDMPLKITELPPRLSRLLNYIVRKMLTACTNEFFFNLEIGVVSLKRQSRCCVQHLMRM